MKYKHLLLLLIPVLFLLTPVHAQYAAIGTSPFEAVTADGDRVMVLVDGQWYETLAIDGTPSSVAIEYCRYNYKDNWLVYFSEELVQVTKKLSIPLHKTVELQLLNGNQRIPKTVTVTKEKHDAVKKYNREHKQILTVTNKKENNEVQLSKEHPYAFRSVKVEYLFTGSKEKDGKEVLFIEDYGKTVVVISVKKDAEGKEDIKTIMWKDNKTTYIDHKNKTWKTSTERDGKTLAFPVAYTTDAQRKLDGYVQTENRTLSGKDCAVYEHTTSHMSYWVWQGAVLKIVYSPFNTNGFQKIATAVYEDITIPQSVVNIPSDYKKQ